MQAEATRPELAELEQVAQEAHRLGLAALSLEDRIGALVYALAGLNELTSAERSEFYARLAWLTRELNG